MEKDALTFNNLQQVLDDFTKDVAETYKSLLLRDGKNATGELISSIKPMTPELVDGTFQCSLSLAPHWKYVESGRRPGKFPPIDNILEWVKTKPQLARPNRLDRKELPSNVKSDGTLLAPKQLAFLVARKIATKGIQPGNQLEEALDIVYARWKERIDAAITADIEASL